MSNILAFIPARGGSQGLYKKNLQLINRKPMIVYNIEIAKASKYITRVVVATDDEEIAKVSRECGAEVPFFLPKEITTNQAKMEPVIQFVVNKLEEDENYITDIFVYFQPTDFFKRVEWVDEAIEALLKNPELESSFIGCSTYKNYWKKEKGEYIRASPFSGYKTRQERIDKGEVIFREDTGLGCATRGSLAKKGIRVGKNVKVIEKEYEFFDVHTRLDLKILEQVQKERE